MQPPPANLPSYVGLHSRPTYLMRPWDQFHIAAGGEERAVDGEDTTAAEAEAWQPCSAPYSCQARLSELGYPFQVSRDKQVFTLANLSQSKELLVQDILQTYTLEPPGTSARARLEARITKLEKKVASVKTPASKHKPRRGKLCAKIHIDRRAVQHPCCIHGSGTSCSLFMRNSGAAFTAYNPPAFSRHGWSGAVPAAYVSMPTSPDMLMRNEARAKPSINLAGRSYIDATRSVLAWAHETAVKDILPQFLTRLITHFLGGN